ncbi:hypothetical protein MUN84_19420 [Hymenobacter sp. 5516J-16]|uniref:hypothetical protein n=1 Tax=Hymenobacter sp. 5516J-16 TaxID=2932253 RepID=UPI001FD39672|nr:hypothetical protein [Hymenobacter sp. 5516J-16]UOQ76668.1 hypothetical protein MUN84_19420 [Hymenobacter sp. 5516J-16]
MLYRLLLLGCLLLTAATGMAQRTASSVPRLAPSFFTTYSYLSYTILDRGTSPVPMPAKG